MRKPRLSQKQKAWIKEFKTKYPTAEVNDIYEGLSGDRTVILEWWERLQKIITSETVVENKILHLLKVKLKISGKPRETADYSFTIYSTQNEEVVTTPEGQMSLDIAQAFSIPIPQNPVVIKTKSKSKSKSKMQPQNTHYKLPLWGVASKLHEINLSSTGEVLSEEELMSESVAHYDLETGKEIKLPLPIVKILSEKQASLKEWDSAILLYQVGGSSCVMQYLEGLDTLRSTFGTNPSRNTQLNKNQDKNKEGIRVVE